MSANTGLIIAACAALVVGTIACATVVMMWPVPAPLIALAPFCLVWGVAMLCFALSTRHHFR